MDWNKNSCSSAASSDSGGAAGSSLFNIASIRDSILQKLETAQSCVAGDEVAPDPDVQPSSRDTDSGQGGAAGGATADEPLPTTTPTPSLTDGHIDASMQEAVMVVTDPQTDAENTSPPSAANEYLDTSTQEAVMVVADLLTDTENASPPSAADEYLNSCTQEAVKTAADVPKPQIGSENSFEEDSVVINSERFDEGCVQHVMSSASTEFAQLSEDGGARDDLNIRPEGQNPGYTADEQNGDDTNEVVLLGYGYRNPYSDSESDTSSLSSFEDFGACDDDIVEARTRGEIYPEELPPMQDLQISIGDDTELVQIGEVSGIVQVLVVVRSTIAHTPVDENTVLFFENRKSLGKVFEVIGKLEHPFYVVRFNSEEDIKDRGVEIGLKVYFAPDPAPAEADITHFIFNIDRLKMQKGSDASWQDNNEPPPGVVEYSDDEEEKRAKAKRKGAKKKQGDGEAPKEKKRLGDKNGGMNRGNRRPQAGNGSSDTSSRPYQPPHVGKRNGPSDTSSRPYLPPSVANRNGPSDTSSRPHLPPNVAIRNGPADTFTRPHHLPHAANSNNGPFSDSRPFQFQQSRFPNKPAHWARGVDNFGGGFCPSSPSFPGSSSSSRTQWGPQLGSPPFPGSQSNRFASNPGGCAHFTQPAHPFPPAQQGFDGGQSFGSFGGQPRFIQYNQGQTWPQPHNMGQGPLQQNSWDQRGSFPEGRNGWGNF